MCLCGCVCVCVLACTIEDGGMSVGWHADDESLFQGFCIAKHCRHVQWQRVKGESAFDPHQSLEESPLPSQSVKFGRVKNRLSEPPGHQVKCFCF